MSEGGSNSQVLAQASGEPDLGMFSHWYIYAIASHTSTDTQFAFGFAYPIPGTYYTTAGNAPFIPDSLTPTDANEPYLDVGLNSSFCVSLC